MTAVCFDVYGANDGTDLGLNKLSMRPRAYMNWAQAEASAGQHTGSIAVAVMIGRG